MRGNEAIAKIFLSAERGLTETNWLRRYSTFNFGNYQHQHKEAFEGLYVLNDETLAGKKSVRYIIDEDSMIVLLPVAGAVSCIIDGKESLIGAGEIFVAALSKSQSIEISNPYENDLVNYIDLRLKYSIQPNEAGIISFDLNACQNKLINVSFKNFSGCIGKFDGRREAVYQLSGNRAFVFVLEGAFEAEHRLLEARDGLALAGINEIEFEALSNEAIVFIVELP